MCVYCRRAIDNVEHTMRECEEWNLDRDELKAVINSAVNTESIVMALCFGDGRRSTVRAKSYGKKEEDEKTEQQKKRGGQAKESDGNGGRRTCPDVGGGMGGGCRGFGGMGARFGRISSKQDTHTHINIYKNTYTHTCTQNRTTYIHTYIRIQGRMNTNGNRTEEEKNTGIGNLLRKERWRKAYQHTDN